MQRFLLALAVLLLGLAAVEGASSLLAGRLLFTPRLRAAWPASPRAPDGSLDVFAQRPEADPTSGRPPPAEGVYRVHPDPLVAYTLRPSSKLVIEDAPVRSDALGLRVTPGPAPAPGAPRIVVLGDSVAFGYGLRDDEALAVRLAALLAASRGPGEIAPAGRTVAVPGWNHANAVHFLLDHLDALAPDIVVYVTVGNDLVDSDGMDEHGMRCAAPDIAQRDPWLSIYQGTSLAWLKPLLKEMTDDPEGALARLGPRALESDVSAESSARFDAQGASIALLAERLAARGCRLLVAPYVEDRAGWLLRERLLAAAPDVPVLPLCTDLPTDFMLATDPHPNAQAVTAMATWIAQDLLARGWVAPGAGLPLPPVDAALAAKRAPTHTPEEVASVCATLRAQARSQLHRVLDMRTADGLGQVYGGLNEDGSTGRRMLLMVGRPAGEAVLEVELAPIASRPDLCPLPIEVQADGVTLGTVQLEAGDAPSKASFRLPPVAVASTDITPVEVRFVPARWVTATVRGREVEVSFRALRVACVAP